MNKDEHSVFLSIKDFIGHPFYYWIALVFLSLLLFLPKNLQAFFHIDSLRENYAMYFGLAFLLVVSILFIDTIFRLYRLYTRKVAIPKLMKKSMNDLCPDDIEVIARMFYSSNLSVKLQYDNPSATRLMYLKIIYRASNLGDMLTGFQFSLQPWACTYLNEHPEFFDQLRQDIIPHVENY